MKFQTQTLIVNAGGESDTYDETIENVHNHIDAAFETLKIIRENETELTPGADETLVVIVKCQRESEHDTPIYLGGALPRPADQRDPYGTMHRKLVTAHTGSHDHQPNHDWLEQHPEFEMEYLLELQKLEREKLEQKLADGHR